MKSKLIPALLIGLTCAAFAQKTTLIGPGLRNGDFNDDADPTDQRDFTATPFWENVAGPQTLVAARTNLTNLSGTRNAQVSQATNQLASQSTGHILAEGEETSIRELFTWAQKGPSAARVEKVETRWRSYTGDHPDFKIVERESR